MTKTVDNKEEDEEGADEDQVESLEGGAFFCIKHTQFSERSSPLARVSENGNAGATAPVTLKDKQHTQESIVCEQEFKKPVQPGHKERRPGGLSAKSPFLSIE